MKVRRRLYINFSAGASKGIANELYKIVRPTLTVANRTMSRFNNWS